jgi:hypothetical protein
MRVTIGTNQSDICSNYYSSNWTDGANRNNGDHTVDDKTMCVNRNRFIYSVSPNCIRYEDIQKEERSDRVVKRHNQRSSTVGSRSNTDHVDCLHGLSAFWLKRMVCKTVLKAKKRLLIPFTAVTTTFLFTNTPKASAQTLMERITQVKAPLGHALSKTSPANDMRDFFEKWNVLADMINNTVNFFSQLPETIAQLSVNLLAKLYELLMMLIQTPLFIFDNPYLRDATMTFSFVAMGIVTVLTMIESIKKITKRDHTDFKSIMKRYGLAVVGTGFAPFLFKQSFALINWLTTSITKIGVAGIKSEGSMSYMKMSGIDTFVLLGFDVMLLALVFPILLQNARRFFDLTFLSVMTPLALSCYVFDDYKYLFSKWWNKIKHLATIQIVFAIFICIIGLIIFGIPATTGSGFLIKTLCIIGGFTRLANPPTLIKQRIDTGDESIKLTTSKTVGMLKKGVELAVFKNPRALLAKSAAEKALATTKLRKKHGQRFVKNLT